MCDHCGCRAFPPIAELSVDHDVILSLAWRLAEADREGATAEDATTQALLERLDRHVATEELGLYPLLHDRGALPVSQASALEDEHRELRAAITGDRFDRRAFYALDAHIEQEEMELFPAAMFAFDGDDWDELSAAGAQMCVNSNRPGTPITPVSTRRTAPSAADS
jgi:hypothetical protein